MANLRRHKRSPYWYIRRRNIDTGAWEETSTGLRTDDPAATRKAQRLCDKYSVQERQGIGRTSNPAFNVWVPAYIASHYATKASDSHRRYYGAWQAIRMFLAGQGIVYPRQIRYEHGDAYMRWRKTTPVHNRGVGHNTALLELKFLSQLMNEAIRREFAESNPLAKLGVGRVAQKVKPELTDEQIEIIRDRLNDQPEWMRIVFEIGLYTGCRFSECSFPLSNVDFTANTIRLRDAKRQENDPRKYFSVPLHPRLRPLMESLRERGFTRTCLLSRDKNGRINYFFRQCGVAASFHSLRVTFVTRCHRGGLSEAEAMRLTNHSSQLIHRIYSRLNVEDVRQAQARIPLP